MKQIHITRDGSGNVQFETVSIDATETVFFTNQDPQAAHWPDIATNELGQAPSANSSQCNVPPPPPNQFTYKCKLHANEQGTINVFAPLSAKNTSLKAATVGTPIAAQQVVSGGMAPYTISGQLFQVLDANKQVIQSGSGIGPGLQLNPQTSALGITVTGTPTVAGTYTFTFTVNDAMGRNLQQAQYSMVVS
jgi:hypothetical protein